MNRDKTQYLPNWRAQYLQVSFSKVIEIPLQILDIISMKHLQARENNMISDHHNQDYEKVEWPDQRRYTFVCK